MFGFLTTRFKHSGFRVLMRRQWSQSYIEDIKRTIKSEMVDNNEDRE